MKRAIVTLIQIAVTLALLFLLFHDPEKRANMIEALKTADRSWLIAGFFVYGIVELVGSYRWHLLLKVQNIHLGFLRVFQLFMIGVFFNLVLPGAVGGDVVKIFYLLKETKTHRAAALLTVLMDRIIGLFALICLSAVVVGLHYERFLISQETSKLLYALTFILVSAIGGIFFTFVITGFGLVHKLPARMPLRDKLVEMSVAYNLYASAWKASLVAFIASIGAHLIYFATFHCAVRAFTDKLTVADTFSVMPVVNTITALPISVSGVGVREMLFVKLLGNMYGIRDTVAMSISLTGFCIVVLWSALGGIVYLLYRPSDHPKLSEMEHEVAEAEHQIVEKTDHDDA